MIARMASVTLAILIGLTLSSCAFGTRRPVLSYTAITPSSPSNGIPIYVAPFSDERFDKDLIGYMRNGYGMRTAKVITETNLSDWVTDALKAELANAGYTVVDKDPDAAQVSGEILQVFCDAFWMYEGKVELDVSLRQGDAEILREKYRGTSQDVNIAGTSKSYALTLEKSLQNLLRDVVRDVNSRLKGA